MRSGTVHWLGCSNVGRVNGQPHMREERLTMRCMRCKRERTRKDRPGWADVLLEQAIAFALEEMSDGPWSKEDRVQ